MIGWIVFAATKWLDITKIREFRAKQKPSCTHKTNNCRCVHDYYKNRHGSRPFTCNLIPPNRKGIFLPSSPDMQLQLTTVGILVSSVMCADFDGDPKLPSALSNYRTTIILFNDKICHVMCGWNLHYQRR